MLILIRGPHGAEAGLRWGNGRNLASTCKKLHLSLVAVVPDFRGRSQISRSPMGPRESKALEVEQGSKRVD